MNNRTIVPMLASVALLALGATAAVQAQQASTMTFFLTSAGPGKGADLGGLEGPTGSASNWRRPAGPAARPGAPI